jgi:LDH2 family malate/lactate/ureidoglycolate dehydrogenase
MVAGATAADAAMRLARSHGVGVVSVRDSNHFGAASCYTLPMAHAGLVGLALSNSDALVAPHGGARPLLGTNPLSVAAPGAEEPFCLDMATSQVSYSRVRRAGRRGEAPEPGWAVDASGRDAAEPGAGPVHALKPLGGYKGQGLAMAVEMLCALLVDAPLDHELSTLYEPPFDTPRRITHLIACLDLSKLTGRAAFERRLTRWLDLIRAAGGPGDPDVAVAGEIEERTARDRRAHGVPLPDDTLRDLRRIDRELPRDRRVGL